MAQPKHHLDKLEFYITNVCNLTCDGCNRFNNIKFKGWQDWDDYEDIIQDWAEKITLKNPVIMGGEPLLNPSIKKWIKGLSDLWGPVQVLSNGTYVDRIPGLKDSMLWKEPNQFGAGHRAWLGVSLHDKQQKDEIFDRIRNFLGDDIQEIDAPNTHLGGVKSFLDRSSPLFVEVWEQFNFKSNALRTTSQGRYTLHDNQPEAAFQICAFQHHKNYHFIRGKIYRCGPVALFPELDDQYDLDLSIQDKQLIRAYQPLTLEEYDTRAADFFAHIDDMIPQCKFCSADDRYHELVFHQPKKNINTLLEQSPKILALQGGII